MFTFRPELEIFQDHVNFEANSPCTWIVYPAGAAGDMLASIVNYHFASTSARFMGYKDTGQVIFRASDQKFSNQQKTLEFNDHFFAGVNRELATANVNISKLDQLIFSNHWHDTDSVNKILHSFPNGRVIRINITSMYHLQLIRFCASLKNRNVIRSTVLHANLKKVAPEPFFIVDPIADPRVLEINFDEIFNSNSFELMYDRLIKFLGVPIKLIRFDFVQHWIDQQHPTVQQAIRNI